MVSQSLKPDESIVIPKRDMAEAARGELESLLLDYLHPGDIEKFAEKISKNWKITMTKDVMTGDYVMHKPALQKTSRRLHKLVIRDWQVTTILSDNLFIETDCNSGDKRRIRKSYCKCGKPVLIEYNTTGFRKDGKRIFYPERDQEGYHVFRCKTCRQPVNESVPGAEFERN
jgi:hypothetical protein